MSSLESGKGERECARFCSNDKTAIHGPDAKGSDLENGLATSKAARTEKSTSIKTQRPDMPWSSEITYDNIFEELAKLHLRFKTYTENYSETDIVDAMHLKNLWYLRSKISKHVLILNAAQADICGGKFEQVINPEETRRDLKHYTSALKDWEYWKENKKFMTASLTRMQFLTAHLATIDLARHFGQSKSCSEDDFLFQAQQKMRDHLKHDFLTDEAHERHESVFMAAAVKRRSDFQMRILIAVSAGLALVVPMLIMSLHQSKLTSLLTTSVFVLVVAILLAWVMEDAQNKDIVAATAAYAAVLVVFVGTGSGGG